MRCTRCGNDNPDGNRFCGMCGATLLQPPPVAVVAPRPSAPEAASPAAVVAPPARSEAAPVRPSADERHSSASISGPSFLGLNDPPERKRASLSIDPHSSQNNLEYLLDDEEQPKSSGWGKVLLILLALGLAVGFGYLRWKNQSMGWLRPAANKPSAVSQPSTPDTNSAATPPTAAAGSVPSPASPSTAQPAAATPVNQAAQPAATSPTSATVSTPPAGTSTGPAAPTQAPAAASTSPNSDAAATPASGAAPSATAPSTATPPPTIPSSAAPSAVTPTDHIEKPKPAPDAAEAPRRPPVKPVDKVTEAQKYLYGKGVTQDCDRGLRLLKSAANESNPKAMIEMGALYSAGLCTPHDLPTAYRWFALALRKDPDNQAAQTDLQKLWGEMTQPERQLAIKLTQ